MKFTWFRGPPFSIVTIRKILVISVCRVVFLKASCSTYHSGGLEGQMTRGHAAVKMVYATVLSTKHRASCSIVSAYTYPFYRRCCKNKNDTTVWVVSTRAVYTRNYRLPVSVRIWPNLMRFRTAALIVVISRVAFESVGWSRRWNILLREREKYIKCERTTVQ